MIDFIKTIITKAGEEVLHTTKTIRGKKEGGGNWVTEADLRSEDYIINAIQKKFSTHTILSEERISSIHNLEKQEHCWIIDPLDGTTNATHGVPFFGISIAHIEHGIIRYGAVYDPNRKELFWAEKGKGAWCQDEKITVKNSDGLNGAIIDVGSPYLSETFQKTYPIGETLHAHGARMVNFGSAVLEICYVACGRLSGYVECGLKPWDVAAGKLILEEAGGVMTSFRSDTFSIFHPDEVLAGNSIIVKEIKKCIT